MNTWLDPRDIDIVLHQIRRRRPASSAQRNWGAYAADHFRRMELITERLPPLKPRKLVFPCAAPTGHLGAWTLLTPERMLASPTQTSAFINGAVAFQEDRSGPPSRAYLKLWEALTLLGVWPQPGETCLDLGASPGGWSFALASLGAEVTACGQGRRWTLW